MTDRHAGYVVILDQNIREDDAEFILNAIRMIKGVADVKPVVASAEQQIAEGRAHMKMREKLIDFIKSLDKDI